MLNDKRSSGYITEGMRQNYLEHLDLSLFILSSMDLASYQICFLYMKKKQSTAT